MNMPSRGASGDAARVGGPGHPRDREPDDEQEHRETMLDKTIADSFPTSDPPSNMPGEGGNDTPARAHQHLLKGLPGGSWAAISLLEETVVGKGATRDQAEMDAHRHGFQNVELVQVASDAGAKQQAPDAA